MNKTIGVCGAHEIHFDKRTCDVCRLEAIVKAAGRIVCERCLVQMDYPLSVSPNCRACFGLRSALADPLPTAPRVSSGE